jgi:hypothetical protein
MSERKRGVSVHVPGNEKHMRTVWIDQIVVRVLESRHRYPPVIIPHGTYTHLVPSDRGAFFFWEN